MLTNEIAIIGGGAWGVALAMAAHSAGNHVHLWAREGKTLEHIKATRTTPILPKVVIPPEVEITAHIPPCQTYILAVPTQSMRALLVEYSKHISDKSTLVIAGKGYEISSGLSLPQLAAELCPHAHAALLSGPSFAEDVAHHKPTAVVIAAQEQALAQLLCEQMSSSYFRPYWSADVEGVALCGALKNVYAIAAGLTIGLGLGESARAGLLARSFAELQRLGLQRGVKQETLQGLSGFGDLVLTSTSTSSRNYRFGMALGQGKTLEIAQQEIGLVEGAHTARAFGQHVEKITQRTQCVDTSDCEAPGGRKQELVRSTSTLETKGVEMPILSMVYEIVSGKVTPQHAMAQLLARPLKGE